MNARELCGLVRWSFAGALWRLMRGAGPRRLAGAALVALALGSLGFSDPESVTGPIPSVTGAPAIAAKPAEQSCAIIGCHAPPVGAQGVGGGMVEILDLPPYYEEGQSYVIRVRLTSTENAGSPTRRFGFQLTAVRASDGEGSGAFSVRSTDSLQVITGEGPLASRQYVEHFFFGVHQGEDSPVEWTFTWHAPIPADGPVYFYCAANAADGNEDPSNDFIHFTADTLLDQLTPALPVSWGAIKTRYR